MVEYGEVRALLSGVTTIEGTAPNKICFRTLIRNAENQNELGINAAHIRTYILDIRSFKGSVNWDLTQSFVPHIGEGIDERSRQEFDVLKQKGLLTGHTAIIHGTAFGDEEFKEMGDVGAKLIWSPESNLVLYGKTTNIPLALQHGVEVSLGVDWNPTGSNNIFDELRVAEHVNEQQFGDAIPMGDWIKMITTHPARALALDTYLGRLAPGLKADITVLKSEDPDPTKSLLKSHLRDVEAVWVGGEPLYGDKATVEKLRPGECEPLTVEGAQKEVCVKDAKNPVPTSHETLAQIEQILRAKYSGLAPLAP